MNLNRATVLTIVAAVEVAVLLFFFARWYSRRWGWRTTAGRVRGYVRASLADLIRPARERYRFARAVRAVAHRLTDPELGANVLRGQTIAAERLALTPGAQTYAARLTRQSLQLAVAGPQPASVPPGWSDRDGWWAAPRGALAPDPTQPLLPPPAGYVVIGADPAGVTFLDLDQAPGVVEVTGPPRAVYSLLCAIAAQFSDVLPRGADTEVIVTDGVHPLFHGPTLSAALNRLTTRTTLSTEPRRTVLICGRLSAGDAARVITLTSGLPSLRVLTAGPYSGRRWRLPVTEDGRIEAHELGVRTDSAPVAKGVARALRRLNARGRGHRIEPGPRGAQATPTGSAVGDRAPEPTTPHRPTTPPEPAVVPAPTTTPEPTTPPEPASIAVPLPIWDLEEPDPQPGELNGPSASSAVADHRS